MSSEISTRVLTLVPMSQAEARAILRRLLAGYGSLTLADAEGYAADIVALLIGYPAWAGEAGIRKAKVAYPKWPPSYGELHAILEGEVRVLRRSSATPRVALPDRPEPTPEERSTVAVRIKAWADKLAGRAA